MTFQEFVERYPTKKFSKGEVILCEGAVPPGGYVVRSGIVKAYALTPDGTERPVGFIRPGDTFPMGWVLEKLKWLQYYYAAMTDCELFCVPRQEYRDFLRTSPEALFGIHEKFVEAFMGLQMRINALEHSKASEKVVYILHFLSLRFGHDIAPNTVRIPLPLTQQDMANLMGVTRETAGIELKKLEKAGVISYQRQLYVVHTDKLNDLLDHEYEFGEIRTPRLLPIHMRFSYNSKSKSILQASGQSESPNSSSASA